MRMININDLTNELYTMQDVASILEVTPRTITNYCLQDKIPYILTEGKQKRIKKQDLINYLQQQNLLITLDKVKDNLYDVIFARTEISSQKLKRQIEKICVRIINLNLRNVLILSEIYNNSYEPSQNFQKLLSMIVKKQIRRIFFLRSEILLRNEYNILKGLCKDNNVRIINVDNLIKQ